MAEMTRAEFDKLVEHTIRIELMDGRTLIYPISVESKMAFHKFLRLDDLISDEKDLFTWFYIPGDRLVLVNNNDIIRITFCTDRKSPEEPKYQDNFGVLGQSEPDYDIEGTDSEEGGEGFVLPQLIILHRRQLEDTEFVKGVTMKTSGYFGNISSYSSLGEGDIEGIEFDHDADEDYWSLMEFKYLQFIDDDGESNFMPLKNLSVIEIQRSFLMLDEELDSYLGRT